MIPLIGLIVGVYVLARCFAEVSAAKDGTLSLFGRVGYGVCGIVTVLLLVVLVVSDASAPTR